MISWKFIFGLLSLFGLIACSTVRSQSSDVLTLERTERVALGDSAEKVASTVGQPDVKLIYVEPAGTAWIYFRGSTRPGRPRLSIFLNATSNAVTRITWLPQGNDPEGTPFGAREHFRAAEFVEKDRSKRVGPDALSRERTLEIDAKNLRIVFSSNLKEVDSIIWETRASREWDAAHSKNDYPARHKLAPGEKEKLFSAVDAAFPPDRAIGSTPKQ